MAVLMGLKWSLSSALPDALPESRSSLSAPLTGHPWVDMAASLLATVTFVPGVLANVEANRSDLEVCVMVRYPVGYVLRVSLEDELRGEDTQHPTNQGPGLSKSKR